MISIEVPSEVPSDARQTSTPLEGACGHQSSNTTTVSPIEETEAELNLPMVLQENEERDCSGGSSPQKVLRVSEILKAI